MRQISPVWQWETLKAGRPCHPGAAEAGKGVNRRLEFELGAWFEGACGFALVLALSQMMEHGLGPFGRADLHPRRNPLERHITRVNPKLGPFWGQFTVRLSRIA
jgi:hypothetical protein